MNNDPDTIRIGNVVLKGVCKKDFFDSFSEKYIKESDEDFHHIAVCGPDHLDEDSIQAKKVRVCASILWLEENVFDGVPANYLAYAFSVFGRMDYAINVFDAIEKHIDQMCDNIWWEDPCFNRACIYADYGFLDKAIDQYEKSLGRGFNDVKGPVNSHLAMVYFCKKQFDKAKHHCHAAIDGFLNPDIMKVDEEQVAMLKLLIEKSGNDLQILLDDLMPVQYGIGLKY